MNRFLIPLFAPAALCVLLITAPAAQAQVVFQLTPPAQIGNPGDTLHFTGILTNLGASTVYLFGDSATLTGPGLTLDDTPFFLDGPTSLAPMGEDGDTYQGGFFDVGIDSLTAVPGTYTGTFALTGGADPSSSDPLASQDFTVIVPGTNTAPVPEASTLVSLSILLALGLGSLTVRAHRRRRLSTAQ